MPIEYQRGKKVVPDHVVKAIRLDGQNRKHGDQKQIAAKYNLSASYVCAVLNGVKRKP